MTYWDVIYKKASHKAHTHTTILWFSWILSGTTWVSRNQKGKTRKVKPIWIYWFNSDWLIGQLHITWILDSFCIDCLLWRVRSAVLATAGLLVHFPACSWQCQFDRHSLTLTSNSRMTETSLFWNFYRPFCSLSRYSCKTLVKFYLS